MPAVLRVNFERTLLVNSGFLSPRIGCGLMLTNIPGYNGNDVFKDVMRVYNYPNLYADKPAVKILEENEELMRQFCINAEAGKMVLKLNFRGVYGLNDIFLLLDTARKAAYFLSAPEHKLALTNYYRDAMPKIAELLKVVLGGSTNRLVPVGWQSLHDVLNDTNFRKDYPQVERIEIMASLPTVRWRSPVLEIGVNLVNFSTPRAIRDAIRAAAGDLAQPESGSGFSP
jgi:hypothetical protein